MLNFSKYILIFAVLFINISSVSGTEKSALQENMARREATKIGIEFIRAYHESGTILFEPSTKIAWGELAPKYLSSININKPTQWELDRLIASSNEVTQSSEYSFDTILDESLTGWFWYLISPSGIDELQLGRMRGIVAFKVGHAPKKIIRRDIYGSALAYRKGPSIDWDSGGFVIKTKERLTWQIDTAKENRRNFVNELSKQQPLPGQRVARDEDHQINMNFQFKLHNDGPSFTFISYRENEKSPTCKYRFLLFLTENREKPIAENYYGCDL